MRRTGSLKPAALAAVLVGGYLAVLALAVLASIAYPVYIQQRKFLLPYAREAAAAAPEEWDALLTSQQLNNIFDQFLYYDAREGRLWENVWDYTLDDVFLRDNLRKVLAGREVYYPVLVRCHYDLIIVAGTPVSEDGQTVGAMFRLKNMKNLPETVLGEMIFLSFCYWVTAGLIVSLNRKRNRLEGLRRNYIANVTHALKTPVASIKVLAEVLSDGKEPDPERQHLYYHMILREAERQDHMIRGILDLSKMQSMETEPEKTAVSAAEVFGELFGEFSTLCECAGVTLHMDAPLAALPPLYTNTKYLRELVEILLDNALKFTAEGGDIRFEADVSGSAVTFCVRDSGIGIARQDLPRIFDRFYKCDNGPSDNGNGLGLAIAEAIAAQLKERLWAESEPGKGAAFYFTVRRQKAPRSIRARSRGTA